MKADSFKAFGLLLLGCLTTLAANASAPSTLSSTGEEILKVQPPQSTTMLRPYTEEYLRQRAKEVPYQAPLLKKNSFGYLSPLELALLPEDPQVSERKSRRITIGERERRNDWKPLSEEEWEHREREWAKRAVEMGAELANSLSMPYLSEGLLWTTQRFNAYQHHLAEQYRLHVEVSKDDATLTYNLEY